MSLSWRDVPLLVVAASFAVLLAVSADARTPMAQALQWVEAARKPGVSVGTRTVLLDRAIAVFRRMLARNPTLGRGQACGMVVFRTCRFAGR